MAKELTVEADTWEGFVNHIMSRIKDGSRIEAAICVCCYSLYLAARAEGKDYVAGDEIKDLMDAHGFTFPAETIYKTMDKMGIPHDVVDRGTLH